jgi:hypothetical protein
MCSPSSFCQQGSDVCASDRDCCSGSCIVNPGSSLGTCTASACLEACVCSMPEGTVCAHGDGAAPPCGGPCCSGLCAPYAPTGVLVCQHLSGCRPVGDACTRDSDCCGSSALPGPGAGNVGCVIVAGGSGVGVCRNSGSCKPNGDLCGPAGSSCNATCDCCSGSCLSLDTCKPDELGVGRCTSVQCVGAGQACSSSADCCNGLHCLSTGIGVAPDASTPPFVCSAGCIPACGGGCTADSDCCPGQSCLLAPGATQGLCGACSAGAGAGLSCAQYGQLCATASDCCSGVPCTLAGAACAAGQSGCRCVYPR